MDTRDILETWGSYLAASWKETDDFYTLRVRYKSPDLLRLSLSALDHRLRLVIGNAYLR